MKAWIPAWTMMLVLAVSTEARATSPKPEPACDIGWTDTIPQGGIVIVRPDYDMPEEELIEHVRGVRATWDDGTEVAGSLDLLTLGGEATDSDFMWRPDAPLDRTGDLTIELELDEAANSCVASNPRPSTTVLVVQDSGTFEAPTPDPLSGVIDLLDLVCCDGAMPSAPNHEFNVRADEITWDEGYCLVEGPIVPGAAKLSFPDVDSLDRTHWMARLMDGDQVLATEMIGRDVWFLFDREASARLEFVDLASGEVIVAEQAIDLPGSVPLDVASPDEILTTLVAQCEGIPYRCGVQYEERAFWTDNSCNNFEVEDDEMPSPTSSTDPSSSSGSDESSDSGGDEPSSSEPSPSGCGCRSGDPLAWPLLALVLVLRRRRIRTAGR